MNTGELNLINASEVIDYAKTFCFGLTSTTDYDVAFEDFIDTCVQAFNCPSIMEKKHCTLELFDGRAKLPKGFNEMILLLPHGANIGFQYIYVNLPVFERHELNHLLNPYCSPFQNSYQIEGSTIFCH